MSERHMLTYRCALQLNSVQNITKVLTTVHWFGQNGTSENRDAQNQDCTVEQNQS